MGGIPGSSKGCNTCRRRKKGCDQQLPSCGQCLKLGLTCEGYHRDTVWVNATPDTTSGSGGSACRALARQRGGAGAGKVKVTLKDGFARSAYRERYMGLFWDYYLPDGRMFPDSCSRYIGGSWLNDVHRLFHDENELALRKVLLALSLTTVGLKDDKPWMVENGIKLYGSGLATLALEIETRNGQVGEGALATSKILSIYEIMHGNTIGEQISQAKKWTLHLNGELGMVRCRGPLFYAKGFAHKLFVDGRSTQVSASMMTRTRSFLREREWLEVPWTYHPKEPRDYIGDIFTEIPTLFAETDEVIATKDPVLFELRREALIHRCRDMERAWEAWQRDYAPTASPIITPDTPATHVFEHLTAAHCMMGFWTTGFIIYAVLETASGPGEPSAMAAELGAKWCAAKLGEILPSFMMPCVGQYGIHGAIFPCVMTIMYFDEMGYGLDCPEARPIQHIFTMGEKGEVVERFVSTLRYRMAELGIKSFRRVFEERYACQ